jgi:CheY-like chemotaxis protein
MGNALFGGELLMSRKILIVEDSCDLREMLGTVLAARGWNPILAESGRKALDELERENTGNHSHGHADAGYERLRARDDFKKPSCLQEHTHTCGDRVSRPYRPAAVSYGRLR